MGHDEHDLDVSRRDLGALLSLLGGAAGLATLTACTAGVESSPEQTARTSDALKGTAFIWVDTIVTISVAEGGPDAGAGSGTNLRAVTGSDVSGSSNPAAVVGGYSAPNDGGGGVFYWSNDTMSADDGGTIIVPTGTRIGCWKRIYSGSFNVKWFGAKGNGVTDDTAAIQAAIGAATGFAIAGTDGGIATASRGGTIFIPIGNYRITTSLTYIGDGYHPFGIVGELGTSYGDLFGGSVLVWDSPTPGVMLELRAFIQGIVENVDFDGRLKAGICVWYHSDQGRGGAPSDGCLFRRCSFRNVVGGPTVVAGGSSSVCFLVGGNADAGSETADSCWIHCSFIANQQNEGQISAGACWRTGVAGNTKNFSFYDCGFGGAQYGIDWTLNSGRLVVEGGGFATMGLPSGATGDAACIRLGASGTTVVRGCAVECYPDVNAKISGGARFITTPGWSVSGVGLTVEGCNVSITMPPDNMIIQYPGMLTLIGNTFLGGVGSQSSNQSVPQIGCGETGLSSNYTPDPGTVFSVNNFFPGLPWGSYAPFVLWHAPTQTLTGPGSNLGAHMRASVWSLGDTSAVGPSGSETGVALQPWFGAMAATGGTITAPWTPSVSTGSFATTSGIATTSSGFNVPCNLGDLVDVSFSLPLTAGTILSAQVSATNTVTATILNMSGATYSPGAGTLRFAISPRT